MKIKTNRSLDDNKHDTLMRFNFFFFFFFLIITADTSLKRCKNFEPNIEKNKINNYTKINGKFYLTHTKSTNVGVSDFKAFCSGNFDT